ncbi:MAG: ribosome biogenesis factor YjgA [Pseudomonadota bacterium]
MHDQDSNPLIDEGDISKSARKRDAQAILDIAKQLVEMNDKPFASLTLDEPVRDAAVLAKSIKAHGGRKRQIQYLAKLLRQSNLDALYEQLRAMQERAQTDKRKHHECERLRDALINDGDQAIEQALNRWPEADRQHLRQLIRNARRERDRDQAPKSSRALYRYLMSL